MTEHCMIIGSVSKRNDIKSQSLDDPSAINVLVKQEVEFKSQRKDTLKIKHNHYFGQDWKKLKTVDREPGCFGQELGKFRNANESEPQNFFFWWKVKIVSKEWCRIWLNKWKQSKNEIDSLEIGL